MAADSLMAQVLACTTKEEADRVMAAQIARFCATNRRAMPSEARTRILGDIGYCAYYYDAATADRILELFDTEHPFFGRAHPSFEQAFTMGKRYAERTRRAEDRKKADRFFAIADWAGLRAWLMEGICPKCFAPMNGTYEEHIAALQTITGAGHPAHGAETEWS